MEREPIVVIGAGLIGLSIAWELSGRGYEVLVIERAEPGAGASSAAAGMLGIAVSGDPGGEDEMIALHRHAQWSYPRFISRLERASGQRVAWRREGTLLVALEAEEEVTLRQHHQALQRHKIPARWLGPAEAQQREPALTAASRGALWCEEDFQVDNRLLISALGAALASAGVQLRRAEVTEILTDGKGHASAVSLAGGEQVPARSIIVATGAWSGELRGVPELASAILPRLAHAITLPNELASCRHVIRTTHCSIVPRADGRLIIGALTDTAHVDARDTSALWPIMNEARALLPSLSSATLLEHWSSLRPASRDHAPLVGASSVAGVLLATGHGRHGVLLAPVTAQLIADAVEGSEPSQWWPQLDPRRFTPPLA